jgi:hypothetical protein
VLLSSVIYICKYTSFLFLWGNNEIHIYLHRYSYHDLPVDLHNLLMQGADLHTLDCRPPVLRMAHQAQQLRHHVVLDNVCRWGRMVWVLMAAQPTPKV